MHAFVVLKVNLFLGKFCSRAAAAQRPRRGRFAAAHGPKTPPHRRQPQGDAGWGPAAGVKRGSAFAGFHRNVGLRGLWQTLQGSQVQEFRASSEATVFGGLVFGGLGFMADNWFPGR